MRLIVLSIPDSARNEICLKVDKITETPVRIFAEESDGKTRWTLHILADDECRQQLLDEIQSELTLEDDWQLAILPVDTTLPRAAEPEEEKTTDPKEEVDEAMKLPGGLSREEIYEQVERQGKTNRTYLILVLLSTVVAAFGMLEDNVAVVLGAMVIAPLLGPNLALSVGVALGDSKLILRAAAALIIGVALSIFLGFLIALLLPGASESDELLSRTDIGFGGLAIALASGAAAALSLVTGVSSALVGVMVAVALLPPATAVGLFLGFGQPMHAFESSIMLLMNIVCINISAQAVMVTRGITPRRWYEKRRARRSSRINAAIWLSLLTLLAVLLWLRQPGMI